MYRKTESRNMYTLFQMSNTNMVNVCLNIRTSDFRLVPYYLV